MRKHLKKMESLAESLISQHKDINIDNSFHFLRVSALFSKFLNDEFHKAGLNRTQIMILSFLLVNNGIMTPTEFQRTTFRSINAISKSVDTLDKLGLTKSSNLRTDRRKRRITLTEKGLELLEKILTVRHDLFIQATNCLNKEQAKEFQRILILLENHLIDIVGKTFDVKHRNLLF